ncbi:unnamed protein product [Parajaminaea phylloscopi]
MAEIVVEHQDEQGLSPRASSSSAFTLPAATHPLRSFNLATTAHSVTASASYRRASQFSRTFIGRLDRVQELGGREESVVAEQTFHGATSRANRRAVGGRIGHSGCVNALCWSESGQLLASGSDDTRVFLWQLGTSHTHPASAKASRTQRRPWIGTRSAAPALQAGSSQRSPAFPSLHIGMAAEIATGHTANIFSVAFAPHSSDSRLFTAAGDSQIRIFDLNRSHNGARVDVGTKWYDRYDQSSGGVECRTLRCHRRRAKRLATENSPDILLSVAEDGDVRSHDLRTHHQCRSACPRPLLHSSTPLYSLSVSPMQPYLFAVAGESPYAYLYDRRMIGRVLDDEWGIPTKPGDGALLTKCVRRFGIPRGRWDGPDCRTQAAPSPPPGDAAALCADPSGTAAARRRRFNRLRSLGEQITAVKLGEKNPADLIATYSGGGIYRFDIRDEPEVLRHGTFANDLHSGSTFESGGNRVPEGPNTTSARSSSETDASAMPVGPPANRSTDEPVEDHSERLGDMDTDLQPHPEEGSEGWESETGLELDSPTEQELNDFPLYRQLLADGEGAGLESESDEEGSTGSDEDLDSSENDDSDEDDSDDSDEDGSDEEGESESDDDDDDTMDDSSSDLDLGPFLLPSSSRRSASSGDTLSSVPIVYPRQRYSGHLNIETVKEVNFFGPGDEYIVSGSDDGNFLVWDSATAELLGIWEGDGSVVNVVVPHPSLPVLAVSGIDDTVKIFGPADVKPTDDEATDKRRFSRWAHRRKIVRRNERRTVRALESSDEEESGDGDNDAAIADGAEDGIEDDEDEDEDEDGGVGSRYLRAAVQRAMFEGLGEEDEATGADTRPRLRVSRQPDGTLVITRNGGGADAEAGDNGGDDCRVM